MLLVYLCFWRHIYSRISKFFKLFSGVDGNHGVPPIAIAVDNHKNFQLVNSALLGVLPAHEMAAAPFWKTLVIQFESFGYVWLCFVLFCYVLFMAEDI